jgi:hypothetical protein
VASSNYMINRVKWQRPQALLFSNNPGTLVNVPELNKNIYIPQGSEGSDFIILSDHNRSSISMSKQRIETRNRMINGSMRSYHTADKLNVSTSWSRLPSRSYSSVPEYDNGNFIKQPDPEQPATEEYTADGGAGGAELLSWYEEHTGPFWVFLSYDKFGSDDLNRYTQVIQMYFSAFDYEIEKRGQAWSNSFASGFDMWNISMSLEQV